MKKTIVTTIALVLLLGSTFSWAFEPDTSDELQLKVAQALLAIPGLSNPG